MSVENGAAMLKELYQVVEADVGSTTFFKIALLELASGISPVEADVARAMRRFSSARSRTIAN